MTPIKNGSIKELWKISFPLMISLMSTFTMLFVDRLFLARYSHETLRACVTAGTLSWSLILGWITLATLSEVFVAQLNGAKKFDQLANPVWQMIWLSLISVFFFIPFAQYGAPLIYPSDTHPLEQIYFKWMMYTGPFAVFLSAVTAFYIGQGKSNVAKWWSIFGNLCNVLFDSLLIFGISGLIPEMGIEGAAIATFSGYFIESIGLFIVFTSKYNRDNYKTHDFAFRPSLFKQCFKIGLPPAIFSTLEVMAWAVFYSMMAKISFEHIFIGGVCQSILFLFIFFGMGLEKGAASVAGNLIGAGKKSMVKNVLLSGTKLVLFYGLFMLTIFFIFPDPLINLFLKNPEAIESIETTNFVLTVAEMDHYRILIRKGLLLIAAYLTFENLRWLLSGMLTAAGDTIFLMIAGTTSVWLFLIAPTYYFIVLGEKSILQAFVIWVAYGMIISFVYYLRFMGGSWKEKTLMEEEKEESSAFLPSKEFEDF
jgi:MATE family multidrug resistance protein